MHVFIPAAIGPLGRNYNTVVWPWNVAMVAFLLLLFFRPADEPRARDIVWGSGFAFQKLVLVLFLAMPALHLFNLEMRIYKNVARGICGYSVGAATGADVELVVDERLTLMKTPRPPGLQLRGFGAPLPDKP